MTLALTYDVPPEKELELCVTLMSAYLANPVRMSDLEILRERRNDKYLVDTAAYVAVRALRSLKNELQK